MNRKKRCWFHDWQDSRRVGVLSMLETCSKCGERRVFDGCTGDYIYFPPIKKGLAMSDEYTPTTDEVRNNMALGVAVAQACADDGHPELPQDINWPRLSVRPAAKRQFDAWLAAHDRALREQIAREIEAKADDPDPTLEPQFFMAMDIAADIARGEDQTDE